MVIVLEALISALHLSFIPERELPLSVEQVRVRTCFYVHSIVCMFCNIMPKKIRGEFEAITAIISNFAGSISESCGATSPTGGMPLVEGHNRFFGSLAALDTTGSLLQVRTIRHTDFSSLRRLCCVSTSQIRYVT